MDKFKDQNLNIISLALNEREKFGNMLEDYYAQRGWDVTTGIPTRETLEGLNLRDVADDLRKQGKI